MASKTKNAKQTHKRVLRIRNVRNGNGGIRNSIPSLVSDDRRKIDEALFKVQRNIGAVESVQKSKIFSFLSDFYGRNNAFRAVVCSKRSQRRRALFASGRAGYGKRIHTPKMHTSLSEVRC